MLELKNVFAGYGEKTVLSGVNATFEKGRVTSIIGTNGCGKSTLLKVMLGILPRESGEVLIDGQALHTLGRGEVAKKLAYLPQGKNTPDMTVEQMVLHGRFPYLSYPRRYRECDRQMAREAMVAVGISHLADKPLHTLSGGMRQTAYIAMALAQDTDYIVLDEPTTYLDVAHQLELMALLRELSKKGKGIITVMHDLPLAFGACDEVVVLKDGRVHVQATPQALCSTSVIEDTFHVQIGHVEGTNTYYYAL